MKFTPVLLVVCLTTFVQNANSAMSDKQFKAAIKMVRNVCQPKNKLSDEQINNMRKGEWDLGDNGKCYVHCIFNMYKLNKKEDNSVDVEFLIKTLQNQAPLSIRDAAVVSATKCKEQGKGQGGKCLAAFDVAKCIYTDNPENYFFP